jgi:hypothetical protein
MSQKPDDMVETMIANMPEKTGKSLESWLAILAATSNKKHGEHMKTLKGQHGVSHGFANLIVQIHMKGRDLSDGKGDEDLVDAQYAGPKSDLRPIYDALEAYIRTLGEDVELAPKKAYVSVRRAKQFALIQPSTKTRLDLGLQLKDCEPSGAPEASGSWNKMVSHRVRLLSPSDISDEVKGWIRDAYEAAL